MTWKLAMPRRRWIWLLTVLAAVLGPPCDVLAERPPAAKLLPERTAMLLSVADANELSERFMNTALGQMSQDPQLQPLVEHLYGSLAEAVQSVQDRIGLSLPELLDIPQGELTLAVVAPDEQPPAVVMLLDAGSHLANARELLKRGTDALEESGAKKSEETVGGTKFIVYEGVGPRDRKAIYFEKEATIVFGTDIEVLKQLLAVWNGEEAPTLSDNENFAAIMHRCRGGKGQEPQFIWYVDPISIMRSIGQRNVGVRLAVAMLPALGLDGLTALGGSVALDAGPFDSIVHAHLLLDNPRDGVIEMIALRPGETKPEPWVPADVASYTTLHWDMTTTYTTLASLYDSFRGEGALAGELKQRVLEPTGLDVEKDVLPSLDGRITHFTWIERPVTPRSQATMLAFGLDDAETVSKALKKVFTENESFLTHQMYAGKEYYQWSPPQLGEEAGEPGRPVPCFGVMHDYLMITDRPSLFQKVIATAEGSSESLADALDFKLIASKIRRQSAGTKPAMISFSRPEEPMRLLYELAVGEASREQLRNMAEDNPFFRSLDTALEANPLPPFAVIQRYLAPGGAMVVDDETGIHYMGFSLRRKLD